MKITPDQLVEIQSLTAINAHGDALELGANILGLTDLAEKFRALNYRHRNLGYLSYRLQAERDRLSEELTNCARRMLSSSEEFDLFDSCF